MSAGISVSPARRQPEQALAWVGIVFQYPLSSVQPPQLLSITYVQQMAFSDVLDGFNHTLQSPPVLDLAQPVPVYDVSTQSAFYPYFIKVHNLEFFS